MPIGASRIGSFPATAPFRRPAKGRPNGPAFAGFPWLCILATVSSLDIRKAAVLLMSLPKEAAGQLMGKLTPQQNQLVSVEIAKIDLLSGDEQDSAINDFVAASQDRKSTRL